MAASTNTPPKDTIYIDVDDEITGIIDKLRGSDGKIVALVLPKRASVFQSIVNMKLLKRAADDAKKHLVLITSETGLLPLAGLAGVHVASSLTSKPSVPLAPSTFDDQEETVDEATGEPADANVDVAAAGDVPIGVLAGLPVAADDVETIDMADDEAEPADAAAVVTEKPKKLKKDQKLRVPNFERFRLLLVLGVLLLIAAIVGIIVALTVLPKATIAVTTDATTVNTNLNLITDSKATVYTASSHTLPAKLVSQQKVYTQQAATTGQKNNGEKASGQVKVTNCSGQDITISAGTGVSSGNYTFISQNAVVIPDSDYTKNGACKYTGTNTVNVRAQTGGANYNLAADAKYTIVGQDPSVVTAVGSAMTGGTDNITKIVSQSDIENAKAKITIADTTIKTGLQAQLVQAGLYPIMATYTAGTPNSTMSANVGDAADTITVTETVGYTMLGVQQTDLKSLVDDSVKKQIDSRKQSILDEGLRGANFTNNSSTATAAQLTMQTVAVAGPQLSTATIRSMAAGKKAGDVKAELGANPDVTGVDVKLSPFFVTHVPSKSNRIIVTIAKPKVTTTSSSNASNP